MRFGRSCLESSNLFPTTIVRSFLFTSNLKRKKEKEKRKKNTYKSVNDFPK